MLLILIYFACDNGLNHQALSLSSGFQLQGVLKHNNVLDNGSVQVGVVLIYALFIQYVEVSCVFLVPSLFLPLNVRTCEMHLVQLWYNYE